MQPSSSQRLMTLILTFVFALPVFGQESKPDAAAIEALRKRVEQLEREARDLRQQLDALTATDETPSDDLLSVEPVEAVEPSETTALEPEPAEADLPTDVFENDPTPAASKVFNPDISLVGNIVGHLGDQNPFEERDNLSFDETEIAFEAFVDPYAKAKLFVGISDEGAELEEGFINFIALPADLTARVGKLKQSFGKVNTFHAHSLPWIDLPLVVTSFFGEGLTDAAISVTRVTPLGGNYFEATAEVGSGGAEEVFEREADNDLSYLGRLRFFRDLTESTNIDLGTSFVRGNAAEAGHSQFSGVDLSYRWKPLQRAMYRSLLARAEVMMNERDDVDEAALGFYASADYQFARRWIAGIRFDQTERPVDPSLTDRGSSLLLTFRPSEFSQLRGQLRRTSFGDGADVNELLLQLQFSIGAHGQHPF